MKIKKILKHSRKLCEMLEELAAQRTAEESITLPDLSNSYAVIWDYRQSGTKLQRAGLAGGFEDPRPAEGLSAEGFSPFDDIEPWKGMDIRAFLYAEEEGKDVMVWIPEFWYFAFKDKANKKWIWAVSPTQQEGFSKHPGSGRYVGRYHTSEKEGGLYSQEGEVPLTRTSWNEFSARSAEKRKGWGMMDIATWSAIQLLYLVEYADFNSRACLGGGYKNDNWEPGAVGGTKGAMYHTVKRSGKSNQYRWIEDPFSNVFDWIDGFMGNVEGCKVLGKDAGFGLPAPGRIKNFGYSTKAPWTFVPSKSSDDETAVTDYTWSSGSSLYPAYVGGLYYDYASCGFFCFYAGYSASNTSGNLGSRLQKT